MPSITWPQTEYCLLSQGASVKQMKNCELAEFGFCERAIEQVPRTWLTAENSGSAVAPFGAGFHPFLDLAGSPVEDAELLIPAETVLRTDERQIPVGRLPVAGTAFDLRRLRPLGELRLDDGFADLTGSVAVLRTPRRRLELHWDSAFRYLQVFTPPAVTPGRTAVAIEPMSCPANAFNSGEGLTRLAPGAEWSGSWGIRLG